MYLRLLSNFVIVLCFASFSHAMDGMSAEALGHKKALEKHLEYDHITKAKPSKARHNTHKNWYKKAVFYHIYLRSFQDSNNDGIGDIPGLISKLDYLSDTLGIDAIWLSPIHPSPNKDFGYDVSDFYGIHLDFGNINDFKNLVIVCEKRKIKIILDLVVNHTSDQHPWFQESRRSINNPKRSWYIWRPGRDNNQSPPNNWQARPAGGGSSWKFDKNTGEWYLRSFLDSQPDLNWRNPEVRKEIKKIMKFWFDLGVAGFRLDIANYYLKDELFKDNPSSALMSFFCGTCLGYEYQAQEHIYDKNHPDLIQIFRDMRATADRYNAVLLGEIDDEAGHLGNTFMSAFAYGPKNDGLHMAFNFDLFDLSQGALNFETKIRDWYKLIPHGAQPVCALSNHDKERLYSRVGNCELKAKLFALFQLSFNATPVIYYGDEIGMKHADIRPEDQKDQLYTMAPYFIQFLMANRDGARTPMQWSKIPHGGFSSHSPWLPLNDNADRCNVKMQLKQNNSLLMFYQKLINLRKNNPALQTGELKFLAGPSDVLMYERSLDNHKFIILLNFSDYERSIQLKNKAVCFLSTKNNISHYTEIDQIKLGASEGILCKFLE